METKKYSKKKEIKKLHELNNHLWEMNLRMEKTSNDYAEKYFNEMEKKHKEIDKYNNLLTDYQSLKQQNKELELYCSDLEDYLWEHESKEAPAATGAIKIDVEPLNV